MGPHLSRSSPFNHVATTGIQREASARLAFIASLLIACAILGYAAAVPLATESALFHFTSLLTGLISGAVLVHEHRQGDLFSPRGLIGIFYLLTFCVGALYYWHDAPGFTLLYHTGTLPSVTDDALLQASAVGLLSLLALLAGYRLNAFRSLIRPLPAVPPTSPRVLVGLSGVLLGIGWTARGIAYASGSYFVYAQGAGVDPRLSWLLTLGTLLPAFGVALVGVAAYHSTRSSVRTRRVFWLLVGLEIAWGVPTGARSEVVALLALVLLVLYYRDASLPSARVLGAVLVLGLFFFPFAQQYRTSAAYGLDSRAALAETARAAGDRNAKETLEIGAAATFSRFSDITSVARILETPGNQTRFAQGETVQWIPEVFVPRAVLPDKEDPGRFGIEFGRAYGLTYAGNFAETSTAISQPGEMYLNFGWLGVAAGMLVMGSAYRGLGDYFSGRTQGGFALAIYATLAWEIINGQEVIVALGFFGVVKSMIVLSLIVVAGSWILARRRDSS